MSSSFLLAAVLVPVLSAAVVQADGGAPYQATGFKVGEVDATSAIVWTRLTLRPQRNSADAPDVRFEYEQTDPPPQRREKTIRRIIFEDGTTVRDIRMAVPGVDGEVRVLYRPDAEQDWTETPWEAVAPLGDFTRQFKLADLRPATRYIVRVESRTRQGDPGQSLDGTFKTAPPEDDPARVVFTVSTGQGDDHQDRPDGFNIYPQMAELDPDFFVHTGDILYYDARAKTVGLARWHWQKMFSWPTNLTFHRQVGSYFIKDDHDTWRNDCWPSMDSPYMHEFTFQQGVAIFLEQVPMGERTYRTRRWGQDLQVWMVEGRDFRSPNTDPDGPEKTIWGAEQKAWFKRTLQESDATFRILISPTPVVGPDRSAKKDNHANTAFAHEGDEIRRFLASHENVFVVCGDRHWQYASVDPKTGVREYCCGPASDVHAGGWKQDDYRPEYHRYLNVIGGFLSVTIDREDDQPVITFRHHDVQGRVKNEDRYPAEQR